MKNWLLMVDESNHIDLEKMVSIIARIFDIKFGRVTTKFFYMNLLSGQS